MHASFVEAIECVAVICNQSGSIRAKLQATHRLNGCFMKATSFQAATDLADLCIRQTGTGPAASSTAGTTIPTAARRDASPASSPLMAALFALLAEGQQYGVIVLACLTYLSVTHEAIRQMGETGLVPLLVGLLKNGLRIEPQLVSGCLSLLVAVVQSDWEQRLLLANLRGVASVVAKFLVAADGQWRSLALQLLQEMMACKQGAIQVTSSSVVSQALDTAIEMQQQQQQQQPAGGQAGSAKAFIEARRTLRMMLTVLAGG